MTEEQRTEIKVLIRRVMETNETVMRKEVEVATLRVRLDQAKHRHELAVLDLEKFINSITDSSDRVT